MSNIPSIFASSLIIILTFLSCTGEYKLNEDERRLNLSQEFSDYWFQGRAELTSYELSQARYGELHKGHAVLIFVTEDFSFSNFVKLDRPDRNRQDALKVMKLNMTRKFKTGIYPYSIMQSVFTPLNSYSFPLSLKINASSQEWCGHTFSNMNLQWDGYVYEGFSYFEGEAFEQKKLDRIMSEDEIWNRIRLGPDRLPIGDCQVIPSMIFSRLKHEKLKVEEAIATLEDLGTDSTLQVNRYVLRYKNLPRTISIDFDKAFPHQIIAWEEKQLSGFGANAKEMVTSGKKMKSIMLDYWAKNNVADSIYRKKLDLPM